MVRGSVEVFATGFVFAEGPRWHDGRLWLSDMHGEAIYVIDDSGAKQTVLTRPGLKPSGLGFMPDGDLLFVSMADRTISRLRGSNERPHADLSGICDVELNDMVVDARGRAYVGSYPTPGEPGQLFLVDESGAVSVAAAEMQFPNGSVITPDGGTLIVTESMGRRMTAFDIAEDGGLSGRRAYAEVPNFAGDGLALDADGALWSAQPLGRKFVHVRPGGEVIEEIPTGDQMAIACTFGGSDLSTLFLLTAPDHAAAKLRGTRASVVSAVTCAVPGAAPPN